MKNTTHQFCFPQFSSISLWKKYEIFIEVEKHMIFNENPHLEEKNNLCVGISSFLCVGEIFRGKKG
jgi:hypothetical protein